MTRVAVGMEDSIFSGCVCSFSYPSCNAHAQFDIFTSVVCPSLQYFSRCLTNGTIFRKKKLLIKCVLIFSTVSAWKKILILRIIEQDVKINVHWSSLKAPFTFVRIECTWNFLDIFSKNIQISNLMQEPVGAKLF